MNIFEKQLAYLLDGIQYERLTDKWSNVYFVQDKNTSSQLELEDLLYYNYNCVRDLKDQWLKDEEVETFSIDNQVFNEEKFWFKEKITANGIVLTKDSHYVEVVHGEYIYGGAIAKQKSLTDGIDYYYVSTPKKKISTDKKGNLKGTISIMGDKYLFLVGKNIVRVYFNLKAIKRGIKEFVKFLTESLEVKGIPYSLKYKRNLINYRYSDAAVLYITQNNFLLISSILEEISIRFGSSSYNLLRHSVPVFTKALFPGIGFAEDPDSQVVGNVIEDISFGRSRCNIIASIILQNKFHDFFTSKRTDEQITIINNKIKESGLINTTEPFRNPNTNFDYGFKIIEESTFTFSRKKEINIPNWGNSDRIKFLGIAKKYADELCEKAVWVNSSNCTWVTYQESNVNVQGFSSTKKSFSLVNNKNLELIKLFLSRYATFTEDASYYERVAESIVTVKQSNDWNKFNNKGEIQNFLADFMSKWYPSSHKDSVDIKAHHKSLNLFSKGNFEELKDNQEEEISSIEAKLREAIGNQSDNLITISEADALKLAEEIINNYENFDLPLRNVYQTYDLCPGLEGKAGLGLFFLILYNPSKFKDVVKFG